MWLAGQIFTRLGVLLTILAWLGLGLVAEQILTRLGVLLTISAWLVSALMARYILVLTRYLSWSSEVAYMEGLRSFRGRETTLVATTVSSSRRSFSSSSEKQAPRLSWS